MLYKVYIFIYLSFFGHLMGTNSIEEEAMYEYIEIVYL